MSGRGGGGGGGVGEWKCVGIRWCGDGVGCGDAGCRGVGVLGMKY